MKGKLFALPIISPTKLPVLEMHVIADVSSVVNGLKLTHSQLSLTINSSSSTSVILWRLEKNKRESNYVSLSPLVSHLESSVLDVETHLHLHSQLAQADSLLY